MALKDAERAILRRAHLDYNLRKAQVAQMLSR
jgi:hypothetical protein